MEPVLARQATSAFHQRSHSSSNLQSQLSYTFRHIQPARGSEELPRSASFTSLPVLESEAYNPEEYLNADVVIEPLNIPVIASEGRSQGNGGSRHGETPETPLKVQTAERRKSSVSGWVSRVREGKESSSSPSKVSTNRSLQSQPIPMRSSLARSKMSQSLVSLDDHSSSASSSRSPSPSKKLNSDLIDSSPDDYSTAASSISSTSPKQYLGTLSLRSERSTPDGRSESPGRGLMRRGAQLLKGSKKTQSVLFDDLGVSSSNASTASLGGISMLNINGATTPVASRPSSRGLRDKVVPFMMHTAHPKDELWTAFRSLDSDYQKFLAKTSALKANAVRSTLLPFLRNHFYFDHPSTRSLQPEHLDRRVNVLNKWWTGLLDMLELQNGMSGVDRPVILEAITAIMARPEWRLPPSSFAPLSERISANVSRISSSASLSSDASQFVADSVYHNARTIFIRNLNSQMSIIVEKMSNRHAPASLVTFCGKATAYAFFFCPGMADALARIWNTPLETIKRVADELDLPRRSSMSVGSDDIVAAFPPNLHSLGWTSPRTLVNQLRRPANLPVEVSKIPWHGNWAGRWCGRDSDLFYVFCKHYHTLMEEFIPADTPLIEKARAPAFVLIHAQIVTILDGTLHRKPPGGDPATSVVSLLDDVLTGADASVAALPLSPTSDIARLMCENRLIMLVRDFLADRPSESSEARRTFAESFSLSLMAAAKKTSIYDHDACHILCDFVEEVLPIYMRYHNSNTFQIDYVDWLFWLDVCQKMMESNNSMTEIRLLSFIYTTWNMLTAIDARKEVVCLEWLLSPTTFSKFFMHWSPMVRAYYMHLLLWRICRFEGTATQLETKILCTVADRLKTVWSHYQHQRQTAIRDSRPLPSSAPCHPTPGRRLLIVRNDNRPPSTASLFLSFDGIIAGASAGSSPNHRHSLLLNPPRTSPADPPTPAAAAAPKRRWSLMGKLMSSGASPPSTAAKLDAARHATALATSSSSVSASTSAPSSGPPPYRAFSFKFSLEWHGAQPLTVAERRVFHRDRALHVPRLPAAAWAFVRECGREGEKEGEGEKDGEVEDERANRYAGRALAEWALLVREYDNFVERRRAEGVPGLREVEVPALGVEGLKRGV